MEFNNKISLLEENWLKDLIIFLFDYDKKWFKNFKKSTHNLFNKNVEEIEKRITHYLFEDYRNINLHFKLYLINDKTFTFRIYLTYLNNNNIKDIDMNKCLLLNPKIKKEVEEKINKVLTNGK